MAFCFQNISEVRLRIQIALFSLGFTSMLSQIIILREFLSIFQGNELLIGIFLPVWLILSALGVRLGEWLITHGKIRITISLLILLSGIMPLLILVTLYLINSLLFFPGVEKTLLAMLILTLLLLLPYCITSGYLFAKLTALIANNINQSGLSNSYGTECLGSAFAGFLFSACLCIVFDCFQLATIMLMVQIMVAFLMDKNLLFSRIKYLLYSLLVIISIVLILIPLNFIFKSYLFKKQTVIMTKDTQYGNITVTKTYDQYNFYENGVYLFCSDNPLIDEEQVHYVLCQINKPREVFIISGSLEGMIKQINKYSSIQKLDLADLNPALISEEKKLFPPAYNEHIRYLETDPRNWIRTQTSQYDAVIVNLPDPSSAQIVRYFTIEFFREIKHALKPGGFFSISLSPVANYLNDEAKSLTYIILQSLQASFENVEIIPGERSYFVASDSLVRLNISYLIDKQMIENEYINKYNINDMLLKGRRDTLFNSIQNLPVKLNRDQLPIAFYDQNLWWLSRFKGYEYTYPFLIIVIFAFMIIAFKKRSKLYSAIMIGSFTASSFEIIVLFSYQINYGTVYKMLGGIVALFMLGLWLGNKSRSILLSRKSETILLFSQVFPSILLLLYPTFKLYSYYSSFYLQLIGYIVIMLYILGASFAFGLQFRVVTRILALKSPGMHLAIYNFDLIGSAIGIVATSFLSLPLLGITNSCYLIAFINMLFILNGVKKRT
jgi:spermidine synthase